MRPSRSIVRSARPETRGEVVLGTNDAPPIRPRAALLRSAIVCVLTLIVMLATEPRLSIVWDEGYTLGRENRVRLWFEAMRDPSAFAEKWSPPGQELVQPDAIPLPPPTKDQVDSRADLLSPNVLAWFWPFSREEPHGHPPFYAIVGLIGDVFSPSTDVLSRARFGPMLCFSIAAGVIFHFLSIAKGTLAGAAAAAAWVFQPRLFAEGHYATYDAILASLWVCSIFAFRIATDEKTGRWNRLAATFVFGVLLGWAADTKLTGWFLPVPCVAWSLLYKDRRGFLAIGIGGAIAAVVLLAFNPSWWSDPFGGVVRFLQSNLSRAKTRPIEVMFLGKVYNTPIDSLPIHNTVVWTVFTMPVGFLLLATVGGLSGLKRAKSERFTVLATLHALLPLGLRAMPHTPGHDGVRMMLVSFGVLSVLVGIGTGAIRARRPRFGTAAAVAAMVEGVVSVALMMPVPLAYYSPIVGGLPGATKLGMEPTYYWDALTPEALDWLNRNTPSGMKVGFATYPTSWLYLKESGKLRPDFLPNTPGTFAWYVVQNRPGAMSPRDRALIARAKPAYAYSKWGVPLVWVFPFSELSPPR